MIERLSSDSRRCASRVAFLAYPGESADGRMHIGDALARGASAVIWEEELFSWDGASAVPNVALRGLKQQVGALAHEFYGRPSEALWMCGVTGTNGKTTCSHWIAASLQGLGEKTGVIGTLGGGFPGALVDLGNTTPDAAEIHRVLRDLRSAGAGASVIEVSSHGLVQGRVNAVHFNCALFTNLSHDHLDYHGSMQAYAEAKARLFDTPGLQAAVLNLDDVVGVQIAQKLARRGQRVVGYSLHGASHDGNEYIAAARIAGAEVEIESSWGRAQVTLKQIGRFNVSNALGVLGCLLVRGVEFEEGVRLLEALPELPGRMQAIGQAPLVVIDYAHTPDALEKALQALEPLARGRVGKLVVVFGAGGDRDTAKRPAMGAAAARLADRVLLTSDNPRGEDPLAIIAQIARGIDMPYETEVDRAAAIKRAIRDAAPEDVILIAGKGHEGYQESAGTRAAFSDADTAKQALE